MSKQAVFGLSGSLSDASVLLLIRKFQMEHKHSFNQMFLLE